MRPRLRLPLLALLLLFPLLLACAGERIREPLPTMNFELPAPTATPAPPWAANALPPAAPTTAPQPNPTAPTGPAALLPEPLPAATPLPEVVIKNEPLVSSPPPDLRKNPDPPPGPRAQPPDICYRSPHIQKWILGRLNINS